MEDVDLNPFSLSRILLVALIAVLLGLIFVAFFSRAGAVRHGLGAKQNIATVALAYRETYKSNPQAINAVENIYELALVLAREEGLNDPALWCYTYDPVLQRRLEELERMGRGNYQEPAYVAKPPTPDTNGDDTPEPVPAPSAEAAETPAAAEEPPPTEGWEINPAFRQLPVSVSAAVNIPQDAPGATTPILWTRGLMETGRWRKQGSLKAGLFGDMYGYIVFLDGRVERYTDLSEDGGKLIEYGTGGRTENILEALPKQAKILNF